MATAVFSVDIYLTLHSFLDVNKVKCLVDGQSKPRYESCLEWFYTAWYDSVRHGSLRHGSVRVGLRFHYSLVPL